ncbi:hypothetical protein [Chryseobacterium sp. GP-SGM7]|uniref:hypothetical protein n=1 Tax=Chryseobacterium sp. GP-SGM7 TaxID=3411323 RepID=UPI003B938D04
MENSFNTQGYDFKQIIRISTTTAYISFGFMFFNALISRYLHELFLAIIIVGIPYYFFVTKIKDTLQAIDFKNNEIIINKTSLLTHHIKSYHITNSLRLYFMLKINAKDRNDYTYYLPVSEKQKIESFFENNHMTKNHFFSDLLPKHYLLIYIIIYFIVLGVVYYFGQQIYYFSKS